MQRQLIAFISALVVPALIFVLVIGLNQSDIERGEIERGLVSFDVQKRKQINKPKPQEQAKPRRRPQPDQLPSIKPSDIDTALSGNGLSFGVPRFEEADFAQFQDDSLIDTGTNNPMDKSTVDTPPKVVKRSPIVYPELARKQGVSGYVAMNVLIDEGGNVEDVNIVDSKPEEIFDLQADSTIRQWKFEPATYNGKKVKVWAMQKIVFKLN